MFSGTISMFTLRCTQKLQKRLEINYDESPCLPTTALGDWYANILVLQKRPVVLFVSEKSLLCVLVYARESPTLVPRFRDGVAELLRQLGATNTAIEKEREAMAEVLIGPTRSRSVLGSMNDFVYQVQASADYNSDRTLLDHQLSLAEMPCAPINYSTPGTKALSFLAFE
jgi:Domain of unknown function (DUF6933)